MPSENLGDETWLSQMTTPSNALAQAQAADSILKHVADLRLPQPMPEPSSLLILGALAAFFAWGKNEKKPKQLPSDENKSL
ncbi:MAG: PEP-CTERM sorting domain-containing protein [Cyanobacteria bacterium P01_H01_bin.15]